MPRPRFSSAEALLLVAVALWGLNTTAMRYGVTHGFAPLVFIALRWAVAGVGFTAVTLAHGIPRVERRDVLAIVGLGVLGITGVQVANVYAVELAPASTVVIVFGLLPVWMAVVSRASAIESLHLRHWAGLIVSAGGVALVAIGRGGGVGGDLGGILLALGVVLGFGVYSVFLFPLSQRYSPWHLNTLSVVPGAAILLALAVGQLGDQAWEQPGTLAWLALAFSSLGAVVLGNGLWLWGQQRVGPGRSGLYANLQPVFGLVFAVVLLSESLGTLELVGAGVVGLGILVARSAPTQIAGTE
jgi:drug/metabolite transporter (DMT)-like permease